MIASLTQILYDQRARFFCWAPVFLGLGIALYFSLRFEPDLTLVGAVAGGGLVLLAGALWWQNLWRAVIWVPVLVCCGFVLASLRGHQVAAPKLGWYFYGAVEGTIANLDRSGSNKPRVTLIDPVLAGVDPVRTPQKLRISLHGQGGTALTPGARVMMTASLSPPAGPVEPGGFDFQRKAWFQGLGALGYTRLPVMLAQPAALRGWRLRLFGWRMQVADVIRAAIGGQSGAFAAAIVTGDRSAIDPAILQNLRRSNLAHLLAISGLHMGLLTGFIFALIRYSLALVPYLALRLPGKKIAAVLALLAGAAYLLLSGASVATQRAFVMVLVMLVAVLLDRPAVTLRAVALAALLILAFRPESLIEPGFQMSFAATTALVATFEGLRRNRFWLGLQRRRFGGFWSGLLALVISSAVAGLATAPISAFHFNQVSHYGLLANLASVPVMGFVVMPAAVLAGVLWLVGLAAPAFWLMGQGIGWILRVADVLGARDDAVSRIPAVPEGVLGLICGGMLFVVLWRGRLRFAGILPVMLAGLLWQQTTRPQVLITDNGRLIGVWRENGRVLNRAKGNGFAARAWLENDADFGSQQTAAARLPDNSNPDLWRVRLGSREIAYVWSKKAEPALLSRFCAQTDVLIAPNAAHLPAGPCKIISGKKLRQGGAFALMITPEKLTLTSARDRSGTRLWND